MILDVEPINYDNSTRLMRDCLGDLEYDVTIRSMHVGFEEFLTGLRLRENNNIVQAMSSDGFHRLETRYDYQRWKDDAMTWAARAGIIEGYLHKQQDKSVLEYRDWLEIKREVCYILVKYLGDEIYSSSVDVRKHMTLWMLETLI
ncbi:hypothetical protein V1511DRAFT_513087 [Dipodascopsis uninucleata]